MNDEISIFQKIINREVPANIVYEDNQVIAFLDIAPVNAGHTLVVPKNFSRNFLSIESKDIPYLFSVAQKVAQAQMSSLDCNGVNIIINNEPAAGQIVFHTHVHVIPRYDGDGFHGWPKNTNYDPSQAEGIAEKLREAVK